MFQRNVHEKIQATKQVHSGKHVTKITFIIILLELERLMRGISQPDALLLNLTRLSSCLYFKSVVGQYVPSKHVMSNSSEFKNDEWLTLFRSGRKNKRLLWYYLRLSKPNNILLSVHPRGLIFMN